MQAVALVLISMVVLSTYAIQGVGLPGAIKFVPELLSGMVALYILFVGARDRFQYVQAKYWITFGVLTFVIVCGLFTNSVDSGPAISGMRYYLRALPFFFLPAVFNFSEREIKFQLSLLLGLAFLQIPLAAYQRWLVLLENRATGDPVVGTLEESGALSLFLISSLLVIVGLYLKKRISRLSCVLLGVLLLIPTTINETKISFLLVPVGLMVAIMVGAPSHRRLKMAGWASLLLVLAGAAAIPVYDYMQRNNPYPQEISLALVTDPRRNYLELRNAGVGATSYVGRKDAITIPIKFLSKDPVWIVFGLGIGNASESSLGEKFTGEYGHLFKMVTISDTSLFLLERGFSGTALYFVLLWFVFRDSVVLARRDSGLWGAIAIGWTGVIAIMTISTFYKVTQGWSSLAFLFWYFSGLVAAKRAHLPATAIELNEPVISSASMRKSLSPDQLSS